jgi:hypothetical protein
MKNGFKRVQYDDHPDNLKETDELVKLTRCKTRQEFIQEANSILRRAVRNKKEKGWRLAYVDENGRVVQEVESDILDATRRDK